MAGHFPLYFRNFIFGVEDSLVSTVGLLAGIAIGGVSRETIFLTGAVVILVEAFSMAAGSFLVESSIEEYTHKRDKNERPLAGGVVMFFSYVLAGFIPLASYIFFVEDTTALYMSALTSLVALFVLGLIGGSLSHVHVMRRGVRMMLVGGIAIGAGVVAGLIFAV
ncbi:MAG TPA: VIT1/CCC1 transporter family protein [Candidatus Paceibacterota bacterium]